MGWCWVDMPEAAKAEVMSPYHVGRKLCPPGASWGIGYQVPAYSTDMAAAWLVVERLSSMPGVFPSIGERIGPMGSHTGVWVCSIFHHNETGMHAAADTAPLAICLAALEMF